MAIFYNEITALTLSGSDEQLSTIKFNYDAQPILQIGGVDWGSFVVTGTSTNRKNYSLYGDYDFNGKIKQNGVQNVGAANKPIFLANGLLTASSATIASATKLMYLKNGVLTESDASVGSYVRPVYLNQGTITAFNHGIGNTNKPIYVKDDGTLSSISATVGSNKIPAFMDAGAFKTIRHSTGREDFTQDNKLIDITVAKDGRLNGSHHFTSNFVAQWDNLSFWANKVDFGPFTFLWVEITSGNNRCQDDEGLRLTINDSNYTILWGFGVPYDNDIVDNGPGHLSYWESNKVYYAQTNGGGRTGTAFAVLLYKNN